MGEEEEVQQERRGWRKREGPGVQRWRGSRKGKRVAFLPGTPTFQGVPTAGQAVFCFGNVTRLKGI